MGHTEHDDLFGSQRYPSRPSSAEKQPTDLRVVFTASYILPIVSARICVTIKATLSCT